MRGERILLVGNCHVDPWIVSRNRRGDHLAMSGLSSVIGDDW